MVDSNILDEGNTEDDDLARILELLLDEVDVESARAKLFVGRVTAATTATKLKRDFMVMVLGG